MRLQARWVVPIDSPPLENGEVVIEAGRIVSVGPALPGTTEALDLGNAVILPGLVNVHAHLEYTVMRGLLEDLPFFPWIRTLTALKAYLTEADWIASATLGAAEMVAGGITTVADACDAGASDDALLATRQRGIVYREVFGIEATPSVAEILAEVEEKRKKREDLIPNTSHPRHPLSRGGTRTLTGVPATAGRRESGSAREGTQTIPSDSPSDGRPVPLPGISPHAPYTVRPELFAALARYAAENRLPQTIHLAETQAEVDLIARGTGPFAEMFARRGIAWNVPGTTPTEYLANCGALTPGTLVVHCIHVNENDGQILQERGCTVAHCPKSNGKLGAGFAPIRLLKQHGIPIGLGTDSVASNNNADMFEEMRAAVFVARAREQDTQALTASEALHMATLGGAKALGLDDEIGSLTPGKRADLCVVSLDTLHNAPTDNDNPVAALVFNCRASDVILTLCDGQVLYRNGEMTTVPTQELRAAVSAARKRLVIGIEELRGKTF